MSNMRLITADDVRNAPDLTHGLPPSDPLAGPLPRNLPITLHPGDLVAAQDVAAILDALEPTTAAQVVRWLVARLELDDLW